MQFLLGDGGSLAAAALEAEVTMDCLFGGVLLADAVVQLVPWTRRCIGGVLRFLKKKEFRIVHMRVCLLWGAIPLYMHTKGLNAIFPNGLTDVKVQGLQKGLAMMAQEVPCHSKMAAF